MTHTITLMIALATFAVSAASTGCAGMQKAGEASRSVMGEEVTGSPQSNGKALGQDKSPGAPQELPWVDEAASNDPNHLTLGMKYVTYVKGGKPVVSRDQLKSILKGINAKYKPCNMHFRVEEFIEATPEDLGLDYNPSSMNQLDPIRSQFDTGNHILVVGTGTWDKSGGLGADGANAWATMPGITPSGAVIEDSASKMPELVAHEIGHLLNLDHESDQSNLMNPVIYSGSNFAKWQCEEVRNAALTAVSTALR